MKIMKITAATIVMILCLSLITVFAATEPPAGVIRVTKADPSSPRKASIFVHSSHPYKCETCHHTWDGGDIKKCADCHPIFHHTEHEGMECNECHKSWEMSRDIKECGDCHSDEARVDKSGTPNIIRVSHRAICKRCHRELELAGKPTGPTSPCTSCHKED